MGHVFADVTLTNLDDPGKEVEVEALVDTGATFSVIPASIAEELGIEATERRSVETVTGSLEMDLAWAVVAVNGRRGPMPVLINPDAGRVLLGVVALEILGLGVDPSSGQLTEVNALLY
jgi:clan AA aspartic protease